MMTRPIALASLLVAALSLGPARAAPGGCQLATAGTTNGACTYVANGPGTFTVATLSGYQIKVCDGEGKNCDSKGVTTALNQPQSGTAVARGAIASVAGDIVTISIGIGQMIVPNGPVIRWQDGFIKGQDS